MGGRLLRFGLASIAVPLVVAVAGGFGGSALYWKVIGEGETDEARAQADAQAAQADLRVSLAEFRGEAPRQRAVYAEAQGLWRDGRRLALEGEYAAARGKFREAAGILVAACPGCPGVLLTPG